MSGSGFSYKGVDIGNVVTSNNSSSPTFSSYNLQYTPTNYDYQKPLDFNLSEGGSSLHNQCTAGQTTHNSDVTNAAAPVYAKSVRLLLRGGQGGTGGTAGNAKAKANSNSATGYGGAGGSGGWVVNTLSNAISIGNTGVNYSTTIGTVGNTGVTGNSNSSNGGISGDSTTSGPGGTGDTGNSTTITFYDSNNTIIAQAVADGGTGGGGGNSAKAKANNTNGNTSSNQGSQGTQPDQTTTANGGNNYPDIDPNSSTGFVQIVWLYD